MPDYSSQEPIGGYPPNSHKSQTPAETKAPKMEKVVSGGVKKQKRSLGKKLAETFLEDDTKSVGSYILHDVLIPAGKSMICDIVGWGGFAEMMLFGDKRTGGRNSSIRRDGNRSVINYGSFSRDSRDSRRDVNRPREISRVGRARHDFDEIILDTRGDAEEVLSNLFDLVRDYGQATVSDLYDLVGITSNFTDEKYGWTDLAGSNVARVKNGYLINLPRTQPLD